MPLPNALGEVLTPSAVSVTDDGRILVEVYLLARGRRWSGHP